MMIFHWLGVVFTICSICVLFSRSQSKEHKWLLCVLIFVAIFHLGKIAGLMSDDYGGKMTALRFTYLGISFMVFSCFMFIMNYFRYHVPKSLVRTLVVFHLLIFVLAFTSDQHDLFYKNIIYSEDGGLITEAGIFFNIYVVIVIAYFFAIVIAAIRYKKKYKERHDRLTWWAIFLTACIQCLFFFIHVALKSFAIENPIENPVVRFLDLIDKSEVYYLLISLTMFEVIFRHKHANLIGTANQILFQDLDSPVWVYDRFGNLLARNKKAKALIEQIDMQDEEQFLSCMSAFQTDGYYTINGIPYECKHKEVVTQNTKSGCYYMLVDQTKYVMEKSLLMGDIEEKQAELEQFQNNLIVTFADMVEMRDDSTGMHTKRTSEYVRKIAMELQRTSRYAEVLTEDYIDNLTKAAILHDVGKIAIPDAILKKPGRLTDDEFEIIKTHTTFGGEIIYEAGMGMDNEYLKIAYEIAMYHHEKWNGKGYPKGLKAEEIPLSARIMAVADVYDALVAKRCYKESMSAEQAIEIIKEGENIQFDQEVVQAFLQIVE